jgi:hypothetical protein
VKLAKNWKIFTAEQTKNCIKKQHVDPIYLSTNLLHFSVPDSPLLVGWIQNFAKFRTSAKFRNGDIFSLNSHVRILPHEISGKFRKIYAKFHEIVKFWRNFVCKES